MKQRSVNSLFSFLERRFGNLSDLIEPQNVRRVLEVDRLDKESLRALTSHEILAIHVKRFFPREEAKALAERLLEKELSDGKAWTVSDSCALGASDVSAVAGTPLNLAMGNPTNRGLRTEIMEQYLDDAEASINWFRYSPASSRHIEEGTLRLSPLDKLRLELDEQWAHGATVLKDQRTGRPFLPGVGRITHGPTLGPDGFIHVDDLAPLTKQRGLFSANIYLEVPPRGGELQIWPVALRNNWDFYRHADTLSMLTVPDLPMQRRLRSILQELDGGSPLVVHPEVGDLILLCVQRPHAVQGIPMGSRVSIQTFITHVQNQPLVLDN